ncbi:hypothetical protein FF1_040080 [Malus domestica]
MATLVVPKSPISVIFFIHKAICNELGVLHQLAMGYAMGTHADVGAFLERCNFLKSIYENYLYVKDEAIFAAVYTREKNMAPTYLLQHIGERTAFDYLFKLLISSTQNGESFPTEMMFFTAALQTFVAQCMAKEEDQVFPLLAQFSHEEQASLVWKILCSIPTNIVSKFLPWLSSSISPDEYHDLQKYLRNIVREDNLVEQVIFGWMEGKDYCASMISNQTDETDFASEFSGEHPIDTVILWHNAIKRELHAILEEAKKNSISGAVTYDLLAFHKKLQFVAEICIFHSVAETKVMYPAVYGETLSFQQRTKEESLCKEFMCLIESIQKAGTISSITEFNSSIASHADRIIETLKGHFDNEEVQVLPLVRKLLSVKRQRELLHQSLCVMPLKLIERALPWMVNSLTANEANNFVKNMQLAAPASDIALVEIFCGWASKPLNDSSCLSASGRCPVRRFVSSDEKIGQLSRAWCASTLSSRDTYSSPYQESNASHPLQPIDVVFKVHKAICRDLEYLDNESEKVSTCDEIFLQQFSGFFCFLWDLSRAHSNAEDNIVYPALESRDALYNVSHSFTLDHEQEQLAFENISGLLFELSHLHGSVIAFSGTCGGESSECLRKYHELAIRLRVSLKSLRIMVDQHMTREEIELWPLFGLHFSVEDQNKMVGFILGTTGADVLKTMLPWVTSALTEAEQSEMMNTFNQVTKNTMFNEWLNESSNGNSFSSSQTRRLETRISPKGSVRQIDRAFNSHKKHNLKNQMSSYWMAAQQSFPRASAVNNCEGEDLVGRSPTFQDSEKGVYGCKHYKRNCKLHATCCNKLFTCRYCHDIGSDHKMDWKQTSEMMCMRCLNIQPVGPICSTPSCNGLSMAKYYCNSCKLFDDGRNVYHCPFCNLCRVGKGLGIDYFHCMKCNCCLSISIVNHKCREKCLEANCPICNDFLFTSTSSIRALPCGHLMHVVCLEASSRSHYSICPICCKSSGNMMRASTQSSILVGGDESMEFSECHERTQTKTSRTKKKLEGIFSSHASFLVNTLYHSVPWFEPHTSKHPRLLHRLKKGLENAVAGQNGKERFLMFFLVLCILVLFCGLSSVVILLWFKALGSNKYSYL